MTLRGTPASNRGRPRGDPLRVVYAAAEPDARVLDAFDEYDERDVAVRTVRDQSRALAIVGGEAPDCVVAGPEIGEPDPVGLCEAVREHEAEVPVVLATDEPLGDRAEAAIAADVNEIAPADDADELLSTAIEAAAEYRERSRRRDERERDSRMLEALLTHLPLSIYFKDDRHRHERVSDAMICAEDPDLYLENDEGKAHQHPEDLLGKTDYDIFGPGAEPAVQDDRRVMETGEPIVDKVERSDTRLGDEAYFSTTKAPRYDEEGNVTGIVGVTLDVTERTKYRRDLEQQNERLEEFASMLSHDLRSPLTVVQGYVDIIEQEGYDQEAIEHSKEALGRMEELIDEILTFARHGRAVVDPDVVDLTAIAEDAWSAVDTGDATLETDVELPVRADQGRLQQVLENVFRNAIEHGGPDVTVRVADDGIDFYVEDDGSGVPPDQRDAVFDRGVTSTDEGTGFGLATVETIAEAHGWEVEMEESEAGGARVIFSGVVRSDVH